MIRTVLLLAALAGVAGCGVDGEPTAPEPRPSVSLEVSGTIEVGVTGGS